MGAMLTDIRCPHDWNLKDGDSVDLDGGGWKVEIVTSHPILVNVVVIAGRKYTKAGSPLEDGAPAVVDSWNIATEGSGHAKARRRRLQDARDIAALDKMTAVAPRWQDTVQVKSIERHKYLQFDCQRCERKWLDAVSLVVGEGRFGERTVADLERVTRCRRGDCGGAIVITIDDGMVEIPYFDVSKMPAGRP